MSVTTWDLTDFGMHYEGDHLILSSLQIDSGQQSTLFWWEVGLNLNEASDLRLCPSCLDLSPARWITSNPLFQSSCASIPQSVYGELSEWKYLLDNCSFCFPISQIFKPHPHPLWKDTIYRPGTVFNALKLKIHCCRVEGNKPPSGPFASDGPHKASPASIFQELKALSANVLFRGPIRPLWPPASACLPQSLKQLPEHTHLLLKLSPLQTMTTDHPTTTFIQLPQLLHHSPIQNLTNSHPLLEIHDICPA